MPDSLDCPADDDLNPDELSTEELLAHLARVRRAFAGLVETRCPEETRAPVAAVVRMLERACVKRVRELVRNPQLPLEIADPAPDPN